MKKGLFALAGMVLLISCNQTKDSASAVTTDVMVMNKQNIANHEMVLRSIESGDVSKLDSVMAKDIIDHEGNKRLYRQAGVEDKDA